MKLNAVIPKYWWYSTST